MTFNTSSNSLATIPEWHSLGSPADKSWRRRPVTVTAGHGLHLETQEKL
jgi:hypothetical protein